MNPQPVTAIDLVRRFRRRHALSSVGLEVAPGEIVGLVGPNGSGKTTLLKILAGFLRPHAGAVRIFGLDPVRDRTAIMEKVRFAFAPPPLFETLTAREHLVHLSRIRTRSMVRVRRADIDHALETVGLADRARDRVRTFSFGMRQRLVLAQALLPLPELLVLDEPTDGLDPLAVLELRDVLKRVREEHGVAILLSSHLLVEVQELVDRMLVLSEGRELFFGSPDELRQSSRRLEIEVSDAKIAVDVLCERGITPLNTNGSRLELPADRIDLAEAHESFSHAGVRLLSFHTRARTLEEALLSHLRGESTGNGSPEGSS